MINSKQVTIKNFEELSKTELYAILALRIKVFCVEQNCPYQDIDNNDQNAIHVYIKENNSITAYARILTEKNDEYHIGRVVVDENYRSHGLATLIINHCIDYIKQNKKATIIISAQSYLKDFYKKIGFENTGDYYLEDDIPHEQMQLVP
mgnify:CR=1 FL=1|jgi:ElaA protein